MNTIVHPDKSAMPIGELYVDHHSWLHGWLRRKIGCSEHAADLTQDTFVQLLAGSHPRELSEPRAYLIVIAKRVLFNFWRRRDLENAYLEALAALPEEVAPSMEDRMLVLDALAHIDRALAAIPLKAKQVFLLNQLQELTYAQIAEHMSMPVITVRRYMKLAITACCAAVD